MNEISEEYTPVKTRNEWLGLLTHLQEKTESDMITIGFQQSGFVGKILLHSKLLCRSFRKIQPVVLEIHYSYKAQQSRKDLKISKPRLFHYFKLLEHRYSMDAITFLENAAKLKKVKRAGWVIRSVPNPESVAEHSFMTALSALALAGAAGMDKDRCVKMALIHDLAESIVGDITPEDGVSKKDKHEKEENAFKTLLKDLDDEEILDLWEEYEGRKTPESLFVHDVDKLEMSLQALEYERKYGAYLEDFWQNAERSISTKHIRALFEMLKEKREGNEK